ncbi:hypothetical protein B4U80_13948, partial [Leptotrombidium deliense]
TIANYIGLMVMIKIGKSTITEIGKLERDYDYKGLIKLCYYTTERYFRLPIHELYIKTYFGEGELEKLRDFVKHLKASLTLTLQMNDWMDDDTKLKAQLKANKQTNISILKFLIANS